MRFGFIIVLLFLFGFTNVKAETFKLSATTSDADFVPSDIGIVGIKYLHRMGEMSSVIAVYPNTPAEASGVKIGDKILEIDGVNVMPLDADQVFALMAGRPGTEVSMKMMRCLGNCRAYNIAVKRMDMNHLASDEVFKVYKYGL